MKDYAGNTLRKDSVVLFPVGAPTEHVLAPLYEGTVDDLDEDLDIVTVLYKSSKGNMHYCRKPWQCVIIGGPGYAGSPGRQPDQAHE